LHVKVCADSRHGHLSEYRIESFQEWSQNGHPGGLTTRNGYLCESSMHRSTSWSMAPTARLFLPRERMMILFLLILLIPSSFSCHLVATGFMFPVGGNLQRGEYDSRSRRRLHLLQLQPTTATCMVTNTRPNHHDSFLLVPNRYHSMELKPKRASAMIVIRNRAKKDQYQDENEEETHERNEASMTNKKSPMIASRVPIPSFKRDHMPSCDIPFIQPI